MQEMDKIATNDARILLVDNDPIVYYLIKEILESENYQIDHLQDGNQAIDYAISNKTDLILLDIMMPIIDGFEVCRKLQTNQQTSHIPIIFISAKNDEDSYKRGFDLGAIDYLTKPINQLDLTLKIRNYLKLSKNEQKLKESELRYKSIVEDQTDFILRIKPNGLISYANAAFCNFYNKQLDELVGKSVSSVFRETKNENIINQLKAITPSTLVQTNTRKISLKDGKISWQQWIDRGIFTEGNKISEYQIVGRDVTIQKQYEEAIRVLTDSTAGVTGEQFFEVLVTNLVKMLQSDYALIGNFDNSSNQKINTLVVAKDNEIIPNFSFSINKDNLEELTEIGFLLVNAHSKEQNKSYSPIKTPDKEITNYVIILLVNSEKKPIGVLATLSHEPFILNHTALDILKIFSIRAASEYERAISENKLIESESKFRNIFRRSLDSMIILSNKLIILESNEAFKNFLGIKDIDEKKENLKSFIHQNDIDSFNLWLEDVFTKGKVKTIEIRLLNKHKKTKHMEINSSTIKYRNNSTLLFVLRDITERKEVQSKIFNTILETEDKERRRFAQDLHDGMGPLLSTIKLYTRSILTARDVKNKEIAIEKSLETIDEAITQIKEISYNMSPSILKDFGLIVAVKSFVNKFNETRKININFQSDVNQRFTSNIEASLFRVIIELINNTVKHAHANNALIEISKEKKQLYVVYSDDGIGFEINKTLNKSKGQGLFNIINRIKSVGGEITFDTDLNKGFNVNISIDIDE